MSEATDLDGAFYTAILEARERELLEQERAENTLAKKVKRERAQQAYRERLEREAAHIRPPVRVNVAMRIPHKDLMAIDRAAVREGLTRTEDMIRSSIGASRGRDRNSDLQELVDRLLDFFADRELPAKA